MTAAHTYQNGVKVSSDNPCPGCGKEDWCLHLSDEAFICNRIDNALDGWVKAGVAKNNGTIFVKQGSQRQQQGLPYAQEILPLTLDPKTDLPQWVTLSTIGNESERQIEYYYPDPETGEPVGKVVRKQWTDRRPAYKKDDTKEIRPWHWAEPYHPNQDKGWWSDRGKGNKPWPLYREAEVREAIASGPQVLFLLGGEQDVETAREIGLLAFCNQGGEGSHIKQLLEFVKKNKPQLLCIPHDNDDAGRNFAQKVISGCRKLGVPTIALDLREVCPNLKEKGDITNIIKDNGMDKFEFVQKLEAEICRTLSLEEAKRQEVNPDRLTAEGGLLPNDPDCVGNRTLEKVVLDNLFNQDWQTIDDTYYRYSGRGFWSKVSDKQVLKKIAEQCENAYDLVITDKGIVKKYRYATDSKKQSAFKFARDKLHAESLPASSHLRAFSNCTVDLRTGQPIAHDPAHLLTTAIAADYQPSQECPEVFLNFIKSAYGEDLVEVVRAYTAMLLDPTAPYGTFIHLMGPSGSGKGTLLRFWGEMHGVDHFRSGDFKNLYTAEGRHQYLTGCSLFAVPDVGGYVQGLKPFYELVDNGPLSGRALFSSCGYQKLWNVRFVIASVDHLQIENAGDGWDRRCRPLPTKARSGVEDPNLGRKLAEVRGQVISWALAMPREERDRLILQPSTNERVLNLKHDAAIHGDPVRAFVDMCLRPSNSGRKIRSDELHTWFDAFAQEHGYQRWGMSKLINHLKTILPNHYVPRRKVNGVLIPAHWNGLKLLPGAFVDANQNSESQEAGPFWKCIKSACTEGGLSAFTEFGSPGSPGSVTTSKVADPGETKENQDFQQSGSPGSPGSARGGVDIKAPTEKIIWSTDHDVDECISPTPVTDPADPADPLSETIDITLPQPDQSDDVVADPLTDAADLADLADPADPLMVGDRVEIVLSYSEFRGQAGRVRRVNQDQGLTYYVVWIDSSRKKVEYRRCDLKLL